MGGANNPTGGAGLEFSSPRQGGDPVLVWRCRLRARWAERPRDASPSLSTPGGGGGGPPPPGGGGGGDPRIARNGFVSILPVVVSDVTRPTIDAIAIEKRRRSAPTRSR